MRLRQGDLLTKMTIYFYWICRDQIEFDSFRNFFQEIIDIKELSSQITLNMYVTGEMDLKNVKDESYNQFSGRPNWNRIFKETASAHRGTEIGVFLCGPSTIAHELEIACKAHSTKRAVFPKEGKSIKGKSINAPKTVFKFHKENF
jgi:NADPH oxidase